MSRHLTCGIKPGYGALCTEHPGLRVEAPAERLADSPEAALGAITENMPEEGKRVWLSLGDGQMLVQGAGNHPH